jgi:hypothetical protein
MDSNWCLGEDDLGWKNKPFRGSFDGGGFTISNLTMNNTSVTLRWSIWFNKTSSD